MSGAGIVSIGAAIANYKSAKKNYDEAVEERDGLLAAVSTYNSKKLDKYIESMDESPVDYPDGLGYTTLLRVGNLVGKYFRCQASLVITNFSSEPYYIGEASADCTVLGHPIVVQSSKLLQGSKILQQTVNYNKTIESGQTVEIFMPAGISVLVDKETKEIITGELRQLICDAAGKRLITSCPKLNIEDGAVTSEILFKWRVGDSGDLKVCKVMGKPGALRYCGEAYYPG